MEVCRIPRTATRRGAVCFAKLLERVDARARDGFGFEGRFLRPGQVVPLSELGPRPIVLESTDIEGPRNVAHNRKHWDRLYVLWRWDAKRGEWVEIARARGHSSEWADLLREPARIALGRESWAIVPKVADVAGRIRTLLDQELGALEPGQRRQVLAELHDQFAARIVEAGAA